MSPQIFQCKPGLLREKSWKLIFACAVGLRIGFIFVPLCFVMELSSVNFIAYGYIAISQQYASIRGRGHCGGHGRGLGRAADFAPSAETVRHSLGLLFMRGRLPGQAQSGEETLGVDYRSLVLRGDMGRAGE